MDWSDERVDQLKTLWGSGLSSSQVAKAMGGITRNSVIGKIHRMNLQFNGASAPRRTARPAAPRAPRRVATPRAAPPPKIDGASTRRARAAESTAVILPTKHQCKWPIGDPVDEDFHFCTDRAITKDGVDKPYCESHCRDAYQPDTAKRSTRELERSLRYH